MVSFASVIYYFCYSESVAVDDDMVNLMFKLSIHWSIMLLLTSATTGASDIIFV